MSKKYRRIKSRRGNHKRLRYLGGCQNHRCCYCGIVCEYTKTYTASNSATIEHVIPRGIGGDNKVDNCVMACSRCNNLRKTLNIDFFLKYRIWELNWSQTKLVNMHNAVLTFGRKKREASIIGLLNAFDKICPLCDERKQI